MRLDGCLLILSQLMSMVVNLLSQHLHRYFFVLRTCIRNLKTIRPIALFLNDRLKTQT